MNKDKLKKFFPLAVTLTLAAAGAAGAQGAGTTSINTGIDAAAIGDEIEPIIKNVLIGGAGVLAMGVGGRVAVKWVKRMAGMA